MLQIALVVISLVLLVVLCFRGVPIFFAALLSGIFVLLVAGMNVVDHMTTTYVQGMGNYFASNFFLFVFGSIFGKITEISGAAESIAETIVTKLGEKFVVPAILIAGILLTYGGVSVFVCMFALYPLMLAMFKKADISRKLIPVFYFAGAGTVTGWAPGSPQLQNTLPAQTLGVPLTAASLPGWIGVIFELVLVFAYAFWLLKHFRNKGEHFVVMESDEAVMARQAGRTKPNFIVSLLPLIILLVVLNIFKLPVPVGMFVGCVAALVCYFKQIDWKQVFGDLSEGTKNGVISLFNVCAVVGFGALVQATPAFQSIVEKVTAANGNPMIMSVLGIAVLAGVSGSGSGGLGLALPIIQVHFIPMGVNIEALSRISALACLTLDSLPHNGLVVSVLNVTGNSHKDSYGPICIFTVIIPIITTVFMLALYSIMGMM